MTPVDERDRDADRLRRFLLGTASEDERRQVEERLFGDEEFLAELEDGENALLDDYAHGRLPDAERPAFETRFLRTAAGRERVAFARAASRWPRAGASRWRVAAWLPQAAAVLLALSTAVLGARTVQLGRELREERNRSSARELDLARAAEAERSPVAPPDASPAPAFVLGAGGSRGAEGAPELAVPADEPAVRIAAPLPPGAPQASYQAVLRTVEGALVWEDAGLQPDRGQILLVVPREALAPGDYILTLSGRQEAGPPRELSDHYLRVVG
jgi:hypothetical protein